MVLIVIKIMMSGLCDSAAACNLLGFVSPCGISLWHLSSYGCQRGRDNY
jgi:hypothetical protein